MEHTSTAQSLVNARRDLRRIAKDYSDQVDKWNNTRAAGATTTKSGTVRRGDAGPPSITLIATAPGTGKTVALADALGANPIPTLVVTPTKAEAVTWTKRLTQAPIRVPVKLHSPRRPPKDSDRLASLPAYTPAGVCYRFTDVELAGMANHVPATTVCRTCPYGLSHQLMAAAPGSVQQEKLHQRVSEFTAANPTAPNPWAVPPCGYLAAQEVEKHTPILVETASAYTASQQSIRMHTGQMLDRGLVVDEAPAITHTMTVTATVAGEWVQACSLAISSLAQATAAAQAEAGELAKALAALQNVLPALKELRTMLATNELDIDDVRRIARAMGEAVHAAPGSSTGAGRWETVRIRWAKTATGESQSTVVAILRGANDFAWAAEHGAVRLAAAHQNANGTMTPAHIVFSYPTQIGRELIAISKPTVIADATPTAALRAIVTAQGGTIHNLRPALPVTVRRDSSRSWGRGKKSNEARWERDAWAVVVVAQRLQAETGRRPVILTHKPWAEVIVKRGWWPQSDVGWWGGDHQAHNRWAGRDMVIAGATTVRPETAEDLYRADRATVGAAAGTITAWPEWTPGRRSDGRRNVSESPGIQAWDDDRIAGDLAQAIGRVRSLDHPGCTVLLLGPQVPLADYGITVEELSTDDATMTTAQRHRVEHLARLHRVARAAARIAKRGGRITRAAVRAEGAGGRHDLYDEYQTRLRQADGTATELADEIKGELDELRAMSGFKVVVETVQDKRGRSRTLIRAVPDEGWLAAAEATLTA